MTDDSHAAHRGGDPPSEDADATAQFVQRDAAGPAEGTVPPHRSGNEYPGRGADATGPYAQREGDPPPGVTPSGAYPSSGVWSIPPAPREDWPPEADRTFEADETPPPEHLPDATARHDAAAGSRYPGADATTRHDTAAGFRYPGADATARHDAAAGSRYPGADPVYDPAADPISPPDPSPVDFDRIYRPGAPSPPGAGPTPPPPNWSYTDHPAPVEPAQPEEAAPADPYGFVVAPSYGGRPRIEPTPKQPRGRTLRPALAGLLAGLLLFGTGGWFLGRATAPDPKPVAAEPTPAATTPAPKPGAYEQSQIAINRPKLAGTLATVSEGWLARLSGCLRSGTRGGPALNNGEKVRVRCEMDAMSIIFVEYDSAEERNRARAGTVGQAADARRLAPGAAGGTQRAAPSGRTRGNYVEFAYEAERKTVSGVWWDDADTPVAAYLLAFWKDGLGESWDPMRDVWSRYA